MSKKHVSLEVVNPYAAGIDIGSRSHWAAVGQDAQDVKEFGVYTQDSLASESRNLRKPSEFHIFEFYEKLFKYGTLQAQQK
jgi:hypothetical protein